MPDLVTRLTEAVGAAIADERPALEQRPEAIKGLTIEPTVNSRGALGDAVACLERRARAGALLARYTTGEGATG